MTLSQWKLITSFLLVWSIMSTNGEIKVKPFGLVDGCSVEKYTLVNKAGCEVDLITYGAIITSVRTPDKNGKIADVALGFDNIEGYLANEGAYFGATMGRVANRVAKAEFTLNGKKHRLAKNDGNNSLHGGYIGWSSKIWKASIAKDSVVMTLLSEDNDEGYPGAAIASIVFSLSPTGELKVDMKVFVTKASPINLTNHSYFNLAGHNGSTSELYKHRVMITANHWLVTDPESIPTGAIQEVSGSMDLRNPTVIGDVISQVPRTGYDYNFIMAKVPKKNETLLVSRVEHPDTGRYMEVYSNQPGVQFYTSNNLPESGSKTPVKGKDGALYIKHGAFCLETQNYPDAINHENFPNSVLNPGELYEHVYIYKFGVMA